MRTPCGSILALTSSVPATNISNSRFAWLELISQAMRFCRRFLTTREHLREAQAKDRSLGLAESDIQDIKCYIIDYLQEIAKASQQLIRQRVVAHASVYFRRFYLVSNFCDHDPRGIGIACLYLACKVEEAPVAAKTILQIIRNVTGRMNARPSIDLQGLLNLELLVLEKLDYNLVIFNPYRDLAIFLSDVKLRGLADFAWAALNDSYRTDVCLLHPPFLIALAALNMAAAACKLDLLPWLQASKVKPDQLADAVADLVYGYRMHRENVSPEQFSRLLEIAEEQQSSE